MVFLIGVLTSHGVGVGVSVGGRWELGDEEMNQPLRLKLKVST
jgi:hypothetical protein